MRFEENNKAIYLQIADRICDEILDNRYAPGERLPSVRDYAADVQVNANTVMRSYDRLSQKGIIYNKRGIGFFVAEDARRIILAEKDADLFNNRIDEFFEILYHLEISPESLREKYETFLKNKQR